MSSVSPPSVDATDRERLKSVHNQIVEIYGLMPGKGPFTAGASFDATFTIAANGNEDTIELKSDGLYEIVFLDTADTIDGTPDNVILKAGATATAATIAAFNPAADVVDFIYPASKHSILHYHALPGLTHLGIGTLTGSAKAVTVSVRLLQ